MLRLWARVFTYCVVVALSLSNSYASNRTQIDKSDLKQLKGRIYCHVLSPIVPNKLVQIAGSSREKGYVFVTSIRKKLPKRLKALQRRCSKLAADRPIANAGLNKILTLTENSDQAIVILDGENSQPTRNKLIKSYVWNKLTGGILTSKAAQVTQSLAAGSYDYSLTVIDSASRTSFPSSVNITVLFPPKLMPQVTTSSSITISFGDDATLQGTATADRLSLSSLKYLWTKISGPGDVTFENEASSITSAGFSQFGHYILKLTVSNGELVATSNTAVIVLAPSGSVCNDGVDNDSDGAIDMGDYACRHGGPSEDSTVGPCQDGVDNDSDGFTDFDGGQGAWAPRDVDPDCTSYQADSEASVSGAAGNCADGIDNDGDGWADSLDPDCTSSDKTEALALSTECSDGIDNDGDNRIDSADPACLTPFSNNESAKPTNPACSDGVDNDSDGLIDMEDKGCTGPSGSNEGAEGRGAGTHNFTFSLNTIDTTYGVPEQRLNQVLWRNRHGNTLPIIWDQRTRRSPQPAYVESYFHSQPSSAPYNSWFIEFPDGRKYQRHHSDLVYSKLSQESDRLQFAVVDSRATHLPGAISIVDDVRFYRDTMYVTVKVKNNLDERLKLWLPLYSGNIMVGNIGSGARDLNLSNPRLLRLLPEAGGVITSNVTDPSSSRLYEYPRNVGVFAPVQAIWGQGGTYPFTFGAQLISKISSGESVGMRIATGFDTVLTSEIYTDLYPRQEYRLVFAYSLADEGDWQTALRPYKNFFNHRFGKLNPSSGQYEPIPNYCPGGMFVSELGGNTGNYYNQTTFRYQNSDGMHAPTLRNLFGNAAKIDRLKRQGVSRLGVWQTALDSQYTSLNGRAEFTGRIDLMDPAIAVDNTNPMEQISDLTSGLENFELFWFSRVNFKVWGADIDYSTGKITKGKTKWVDLRNVASLGFADEMLDKFVSRGVAGFYSDAGGGPGQDEFFALMQQRFKDRYGKNIWFLQEGARAEAALKSEQIPLIQGTGQHSLLIDYLTPYSTYHGGLINNTLNSTETDYILDHRYQFVSGGGYVFSDEVTCSNMTRSRQNQHDLWVAYGSAMGCAEPPVGESEVCMQS